MADAALIPVFLVTGFLGSGKTTLIRSLLGDGLGAETAVVVNEIGEIPIDHHLLSFVSEKVVVLPGGCVCCTVREDLEVALRELGQARASGACSAFKRVVIETTGLADPTPVVATLKSNPELSRIFFLHSVSTAVDLVYGERTIAVFPEAVKQVAIADQLIVTKCDLGDPDSRQRLEAQLREINPGARLVASAEHEARDLFFGAPSHDPPKNGAGALNWLSGARAHSSHAQSHRHDGPKFQTVSWTWDKPVDWTVFCVWLTMLLTAHGDKIVRVKGLLEVANARGPIAIHGTQHSVDPPTHLERREDTPSGSRLVFVMHSLDPTIIVRSFTAFHNIEPNLSGLERFIRPVGTGTAISGRPVRRQSAPAWVKG